MSTVKARIVSRHDLKPAEVRRMYELMTKYYKDMTEKKFISDLEEKDFVILLVDPSINYIEGFSTIKNITFSRHHKVIHGVFSGDTVLEKAYWGNKVLGRAFLKYMLIKKLKHPFQPLYWFLISKGYKTYLLMANNFRVHFPRFESPTPMYIREILDHTYSAMFGSSYDSSSGLIRFDNNAGALKENLTEIDVDMIAKNKRISYFQDVNPNWKEGVELACIAKMNLFMPLTYTLKALRNRFANFLGAGARQSSTTVSTTNSVGVTS
jgi:hypothetical protein